MFYKKHLPKEKQRVFNTLEDSLPEDFLSWNEERQQAFHDFIEDKRLDLRYENIYCVYREGEE